MSRKPFGLAIGLLALTFLVGTAFVPSSSASPGEQQVQPKSSGLTVQDIANARKSGMPSHLVTMAPQSSLEILARATKLGPHASNSTIEITVGLKLRHVTQLKRFLRQAQYPGSPLYHHWLTPEQFTARYGPSKADVEHVVDFLNAHGITVKSVSPNRILIHTEASTADYENAFGIRITNYKMNGRSFYSTTDSPKIPRNLMPLVTNIIGLNHGVEMKQHSFWQPLMSAQDLSPREAPPTSLTNMNPLQIAHAYNWPDITDASNGQGVSVAILTAESSGLASKLAPQKFWNAFGLPDHTINVIPVDGDNGGTSGMTETLLDVEMSGAMGPGITQNVYIADDAYLATFTDMYNQFVNDNSSDVMTTSWGAPESTSSNTHVTDNEIFMQAAAQGVSMFAAAGDHGSGDGTSQDNMADFPSSSVYIAAANGTQLNISDLAGDYGSEVVWNDAECFGNGPASTGGAISMLFDKPDWQYGPGVPADVDMRMNSGIALTASCSRPMVILNGSWMAIGGTSAVAPQLAGLFAIAVGQNGTRLGQSNSLIYQDARNHYVSDFHDVTEGNNGAYEAAPNWDHPTGWGSVNAQNLLAHIGVTGPKGTLRGKVTAAATGSVIAGAKVVAVASDGKQYDVVTKDDGSYSRYLPVGNFDITVTKYGFKPDTASVAISDGHITKQSFTLQQAPTATLSGKVTDGSGHGYPLYADIKISVKGLGQVSDVWTNPETGKYSVSLPEGTTYTLNVAAAFDGYHTSSGTVDLSASQSKNIALTVIATCSAPGYAFTNGGFGWDFNGSSFPPAGWTVSNNGGSTVAVWKPSSQGNYYTGNYTGGTGDAAANFSFQNGYSGPPFDASLITPPISVTSLPGRAVALLYKANFQIRTGYGTGPQALDLAITTDDGVNWTTVSHWTTSRGTLLGTPGVQVRQDLSSLIPKSGSFKLRWRYYGLSGGIGWYAQIDDVSFGGCEPVPGGLITGRVTDAQSGEGIVGAVIKVDQQNSTKTIVNEADPDLPAGTYLLFAPKGERTLTVVKGNYTPSTAHVAVINNEIATKDFMLKGPKFAAEDSLTMNVMVNSAATASFAISNIGDGNGKFKVNALHAPAPQSSNPGSSWRDVADYPLGIGGNLAAYDSETGKIYSISGLINGGYYAASYAYDPWTDSWSEIANMPAPREVASGAFINGKLYVVGGVYLTSFLSETDIYNPEKNSWSIGAPMPLAVASGAAVVLGDKLYVIGGNSSQGPVDAVQVYDPASDSWSDITVANYPLNVFGEACGVISRKIYCVGGAIDRYGRSYSSEGYVYDPASNSWAPIADIPIPGGVWQPLYATANGKLLVAGRVIYVGNDQSTSDKVFAYDPVSNSWSALPNLNHAVGLGGGTCAGDGFYAVGGIIRYNISAGTTFSSKVQKLPGYVCADGSIPGLTVAPSQATLEKGASARIVLTLDGTGQEKFTTTQGYLKIEGGVSSAPIVPITVHWEPQPVNLEVLGNVSPTGKVQKNDTLSYSITVQNLADTKDTATQVRLSYEIPDGVSYLASNGAKCSVPSTGSSSGAVPAAVEGPATVVCNLDSLAPDTGKLVNISVQATTNAQFVSGTFKATAREPDSDPSNNSVTLDTNPAVGPPGPPGPQGPKGDEGSGSFGWLALAALLGLALMGVGVTRRRRRME